MIRKCCVCGRIEEKGGGWTWNFLSEEECGQVSHVYCPGCFAGMMRKVDRFFLGKTHKQAYAVAEADPR